MNRRWRKVLDSRTFVACMTGCRMLVPLWPSANPEATSSCCSAIAWRRSHSILWVVNTLSIKESTACGSLWVSETSI